jgi:hypothetical protein
VFQRRTFRMIIETLVMCLVSASPLWAANEKIRFLQFPNDLETVTFDLSTVQIIQPGRFSIIATRIDNADVMRLKLKVLATLRTYCARADGHYPASVDIFALGSPDLPVKDIKVQSLAYGARLMTKGVSWDYPYKRLVEIGGLTASAYLRCREPDRTEGELYLAQRNRITNGWQSKDLLDCERGLWGILEENDDPAKVYMQPLSKGSRAFEYYLSVCRAVTHEAPYLPP